MKAITAALAGDVPGGHEGHHGERRGRRRFAVTGREPRSVGILLQREKTQSAGDCLVDALLVL
jgi:hypothetical protein